MRLFQCADSILTSDINENREQYYEKYDNIPSEDINNTVNAKVSLGAFDGGRYIEYDAFEIGCRTIRGRYTMMFIFCCIALGNISCYYNKSTMYYIFGKSDFERIVAEV